MTTNYETWYRAHPEGLGPQTAEIASLIAKHVPPGVRVLDIGCGQGRDALPLARAGFEVVGVDIAPTGIADMLAAAEREALPVTGIVADLTGFTPEGHFGLLLCDRTLHMLSAPSRTAVLARLLAAVAPGGSCLIADEPANMAGLRAVIAADPAGWAFLHESSNTLLARRPSRGAHPGTRHEIRSGFRLGKR